MNRSRLFTCVGLIALATAFWACENEDNDAPSEPEIELGLWYDGANATAPVLPQGTYEASARFPDNVMIRYAGQEILAVHVYLIERPFSNEIRIYGRGDGNSPGSLLFSQPVDRLDLAENDWTRIELDTPLELIGEAIWVSFRFEHGATPIQSIGCDAGPRDPDGDRFFANSTWTNFNVFANGESINWNIRTELK